MAKQSGLGDGFLIDAYDLSCDVNALGRVGGGPALLDFTPICKFGHVRIGGPRDGSIEFTTFLDDATGHEHDALASLPTTNRVVTYLRGTGLGRPAACMLAKQINYDWERGNDGSLIGSIQAQANEYGLQWGVQLTPGIRTDTAATDGASVDAGAATSHGLQAFLHVLGFDGTDADIAIEESDDDGGSDAWDTLAAFTTVTGPTAERIAIPGPAAVERYLRVTTSTTGGFNSIDFVVVVVRNEVPVAF